MKIKRDWIIIGIALLAVLLYHFKKSKEIVPPPIPIAYNPEKPVEHPRMVGPIQLHGFTNPLEHWQDVYVKPGESLRGIGEKSAINLGRTFYNSGEMIRAEGA